MQKFFAGGFLAVPFQSPDASTPSILFLEGRGLPVRAAMVGKRSIVPVSSSQTEPAGMPGPRITQGTRCPPRRSFPFLRAGPRRTAVVKELKPRTVVGCVDHVGVFGEFEFIQRFEKTTDLGIDVFDGVDVSVLRVRVANFIGSVRGMCGME